MGWGTGFKADVYISRVDVKNVDHAQYLIDICQENIDDITKTLMGLAVATPNISSEEAMWDMVGSMKWQVDDYVSTIVENAEKISLLRLYINEKKKKPLSNLINNLKTKLWKQTKLN